MNRIVHMPGNQEYNYNAMSWHTWSQSWIWKGHASRMVRLKTFHLLHSTARGLESIITVEHTERDNKSVTQFLDLGKHIL